MSYEAWGEPDDDYFTPEQASEAGWLLPDEAEAFRAALWRFANGQGDFAEARRLLGDYKPSTQESSHRSGG